MLGVLITIKKKKEKKKKTIATTNSYPRSFLFLAVGAMHGPWDFLFNLPN